MRITNKTSKSKYRTLLKNELKHWQLYLMILPAVLFMLLFVYKPMGGIVVAFQNFSLSKGIEGSDWTGLYNFNRLFRSFWLLIAASHILNAKDEYRQYDLSTPDKLRKMLIEQFVRACALNYKVPTCICHPLYPILSPEEQEVVDGISDRELENLFTLAKESNKAIEIHSCLYRNGTKLNALGVSESYIRLLSIAKKCGLKFSFGSDAHRVSDFTRKHALLHTAASLAGIHESDMWEV